MEKRFYSDTLVAEKLTTSSIDFIKEKKKRTFFLYLAHWEVHGPNKVEKTEYHISKTKKKAQGFQSLMRYMLLKLSSWI